MKNSIEELMQRMSMLSDESLKEIVEINREDFEEYAVDLARKELESRPITKNPGLINFKDLIHNVSFDEVKEVIENKYPEKLHRIDAFREVFDTLLSMEASSGNSDFLHIETNNVSRKALGEDAETGERYEVEFCSWAEWLSFRLKRDQVSEAGPAAYTAICIVTLTTYGYTEQEIQLQFISIEEINYTGGTPPETNNIKSLMFDPITVDKSLANISGFKERIITEREMAREENDDRRDVHPWIRYWARVIDNVTLVMVIGYLIILFVPSRFYSAIFGASYVGGIIFAIVRYFIWSFFEALFISKLGYTPGKWLLNIRVLKNDGTNLSYKQALERVFMVMLLGEGMFFSIIGIAMNLLSFTTLNKNGVTKWDEKLEVSVTHKEIQPVRIVIAVVFIIGVPMLTNSNMFREFLYIILSSR